MQCLILISSKISLFLVCLFLLGLFFPFGIGIDISDVGITCIMVIILILYMFNSPVC